jgi:hypothetical protein
VQLFAVLLITVLSDAQLPWELEDPGVSSSFATDFRHNFGQIFLTLSVRIVYMLNDF